MTYIRKLGEQLLQQVLAGCWNKLTPSGWAVPTQGRKWAMERESGGPANKMSCSKSHSLVALEAGPAASPHGPFRPSPRDRYKSKGAAPQGLWASFSGLCWENQDWRMGLRS